MIYDKTSEARIAKIRAAHEEKRRAYQHAYRAANEERVREAGEELGRAVRAATDARERAGEYDPPAPFRVYLSVTAAELQAGRDFRTYAEARDYALRTLEAGNAYAQIERNGIVHATYKA